MGSLRHLTVEEVRAVVLGPAPGGLALDEVLVRVLIEDPTSPHDGRVTELPARHLRIGVDLAWVDRPQLDDPTAYGGPGLIAEEMARTCTQRSYRWTGVRRPPSLQRDDPGLYVFRRADVVASDPG